MLNTTIDDLLGKMISIAEEAGATILEVYESDDFDVQVKSDNSPLTIADEKANALIVENLKAHFPEVPSISEESKLMSHDVRRDYEWFWMIDPLDGTKEFVKRNGEFTVNIALGRGQKIVAGVVHVPVTGATYFAAEGYGAFKGSMSQKEVLNATGYHPSDTGLVVVVSRSHLSDATQSFLNGLNAPKTLATGSSLKFMKLAEGQAHIYPRLGPTMEWDTAAAQIILEEAGGRVLTWEDQGPLHYNKEDLLNPYFIAKAAESHA